MTTANLSQNKVISGIRMTVQPQNCFAYCVVVVVVEFAVNGYQAKPYKDWAF